MAGEDKAYTDWIRTQPCAMTETVGRCIGPVAAHHRKGGGRKTGMGLKAHDHETIPLCTRHHDDFHHLTGPFKGREKAWLAGWQQSEIDEHRRIYGITPFDPTGIPDDELPF